VTHYYLLVYSRSQGKLLLGPVEYGPERRVEALYRRFDLEREYVDNPDIEVIVILASSEGQIRRTHGRYFKTIAELAN